MSPDTLKECLVSLTHRRSVTAFAITQRRRAIIEERYYTETMEEMEARRDLLDRCIQEVEEALRSARKGVTV